MINYILKTIFLVILVSSFSIFVLSCSDDEDDEVFFPKPKAYPRIDFPIKSYKLYDSVCPYSFEIPVYANIGKDKHPSAEACWINVNFPRFNAQIHISYKSVTNNLDTFLNDSRDFAIKHQIKATGLDETIIVRDSAKVYGLVYDISGNTASNVQFYLTDSTRHFMRGALYFNTVPNIDSLKIVVDYLRKDILHLIQTFKWKGNAIQKQK
jgi:gliding motility-associated lipoprotein GldD